MIAELTRHCGKGPASYILFGLSQILFPLSFIYANDQKLHTIETSLIRGMVSVLFNFFLARYSYKLTLDYKYDVNFSNILKRNAIVVIHGLLFTAAQFYLPLPIVHTVNFFAPIFIFVIDYFQNGVRVGTAQLWFLVISVLGVLCTVNSELFSKLIDPHYEKQTQFKNYIKLSVWEFSLYGVGLILVMFLWAYGLLRVRTFYKNHHTYVNFHLGIVFTISSGFLYPHQVHNPASFGTLLMAVVLTGLPLAVGQTLFVAGLGLNKKTGQIVILTAIPVFVGYLVSYFRYGEEINSMQMAGSTMILIGLIGVIKCGDEPAQQTVENKPIGDSWNDPKNMFYSVLRLG